MKYIFIYDNGIITKHSTLIKPKTMKKEAKNALCANVFYGNDKEKYFVNNIWLGGVKNDK